jgi:glycosyltransferase involved in cell wall biosynthesis
MRIAYLVNQYPKVSHVFIRREILALEEEGHTILRCSVRRSQDPGHDSVDQAEGRRTIVLIDAGWWKTVMTILVTLFHTRSRFLHALRMAMRLGKKGERGRIWHLVYLIEACLLFRLLQKQKAEHLHAHFGTNSATVALLCRILGGPPYSFTVHGPEEFDKATLWGLTLKIEHACFVVAISSFCRSQLYRYCPESQWKKIYIVHCGVDTAFLGSEPKPLPSVCRLVSIGRLCEQKGQMLLVAALGRLHREGVNLEMVLVGDGEMRGEVEAAIRREGIQDHVRITGWANSSEIRAHLEEAWAMVLPSFAEGLPVVIMEALACARPVVSTYIAGIPELVVPGKNGWLVPAGSVEALVDALREVTRTPVTTLTEMGKEGRRAVLANYHSVTLGRELAALFLAGIQMGG